MYFTQKIKSSEADWEIVLHLHGGLSRPIHQGPVDHERRAVDSDDRARAGGCELLAAVPQRENPIQQLLARADAGKRCVLDALHSAGSTFQSVRNMAH